MDALIYTIMSGADHVLQSEQVHANNLANASTAGFRSDLEAVEADRVKGAGFASRYMAKSLPSHISMKPGVLNHTGDDLDFAIEGPGYFAVKREDGSEGYTRGGEFRLNEDRELTINGRPVVSDGGVVVIPNYKGIKVSEDGAISIIPEGQNLYQEIDQLKLVNPANGVLHKDGNGILMTDSGQPLPDDHEAVKVINGYQEGSNVSAVEEMITTMSLSRSFEMQMKMYRAADDMAEAGNRLVRS